jgi:F-type H+-transporting ATPase subunit epsilon
MSHDIDLEKARADLERAQTAGELVSEPAERAERAWAEARIRAAEKAS